MFEYHCRLIVGKVLWISEFLLHYIFYYLYPFTKHLIHHVMKDSDVGFKGQRPWDVSILKPELEKDFYTQIFWNGTNGLGETYVAGIWDCSNLEELVVRCLKNNTFEKFINNPIYKFYRFMDYGLFNLQSEKNSVEVVKHHYDARKDILESMLGESMIYSCAYWKNATTLEEAQLQKMELIARKLYLKPGMRLLDLGCGWGALSEYLAKNYKVNVVGVTLGVEGAKIAKQRCKDLSVEIRELDYRVLLKTNEKFDRIVALEIFLHIGAKNYKTFFKTINHCLNDDGLFLMHNIGVNHNNPGIQVDLFIHRHVFPNYYLPTLMEISKATFGTFIIEDLHNFGYDYYKTFTEYKKILVTNRPKLALQDPQFDIELYRNHYYYLSLAAAATKARKIQVWQIVFSKDGVEGGYDSVR